MLRWLERPGVRLVHVEGEWSLPAPRRRPPPRRHDAVEESRLALVPFDERRSITPTHRPAR